MKGPQRNHKRKLQGLEVSELRSGAEDTAFVLSGYLKPSSCCLYKCKTEFPYLGTALYTQSTQQSSEVMSEAERRRVCECRKLLSYGTFQLQWTSWQGRSIYMEQEMILQQLAFSHIFNGKCGSRRESVKVGLQAFCSTCERWEQPLETAPCGERVGLATRRQVKIAES